MAIRKRKQRGLSPMQVRAVEKALINSGRRCQCTDDSHGHSGYTCGREIKSRYYPYRRGGEIIIICPRCHLLILSSHKQIY